MSILLFIVILVVLVLVHEFGHFVAAKKSGIRVDEFGVGFPPKLWSIKRGETEYSLNALPLGGFVKIFGENPDDASLSGPDRERSFAHKPKIVQSVVLLAGIACNIIFAWPLLTAAYVIGMPTSISAAPAGAEVEDAVLVVTGVMPGTPAEGAGFQPGDTILSLSMEEFLRSVQGSEGKEIVFSIKRGTETLTLSVTPEKGVITDEKETPAIGVALDTVGIVRLGLLSAMIEGGKSAALLTRETVIGLASFFADIFRGSPDFTGIAGPVGIAGIVGDASALGISYILIIAALISINLGLINLLPIPALDGGRFLFVIIEAVKGSPIRPQFANALHGIFFALLILLILIVTYNDIVRLITE